MPGHDHGQSIGAGTPPFVKESGVRTDLLRPKEPLLIVGRKSLLHGMRVAICRTEEAGYSLITDSTGEVYLFDVRFVYGPPYLDLRLVDVDVPSHSEFLMERRQMEKRINHEIDDSTLHFVPVDACPLAKAPRGRVYAVFKDGEPLRFHGQTVVIAIGRTHGERTFNTYPDSRPITEKFALPRDTVLVPFRSTENTPLRGGWF